jgi:hypothetical protein
MTKALLNLYVVRRNIEYSILVHADDEDAAIKRAITIPLEDWGKSASGYEVEPEVPR